MPKLSGNKGEWSEIYVFLRLLEVGKLYAADADLNKMDDVFYNIINIVRGTGFEGYAICFRHPEVGLAILFLGACGSFAAYFMFNYAVSHIPASQVSTINTNLLTMTGVITGIIIQGDSYGWYTVVGMLMIVIGVITANWKTEFR